jgi:hypothetical protein
VTGATDAMADKARLDRRASRANKAQSGHRVRKAFRAHLGSLGPKDRRAHKDRRANEASREPKARRDCRGRRDCRENVANKARPENCRHRGRCLQSLIVTTLVW